MGEIKKLAKKIKDALVSLDLAKLLSSSFNFKNLFSKYSFYISFDLDDEDDFSSSKNSCIENSTDYKTTIDGVDFMDYSLHGYRSYEHMGDPWYEGYYYDSPSSYYDKYDSFSHYDSFDSFSHYDSFDSFDSFDSD
jgi:hypothetical protein